MSISDAMMWRYFTLLSFRPMSEIDALRAECEAGRNPKEAKVLLARELVERFHGAGSSDAAVEDFELRARGGVPDEIEEVTLSGAPLGIVAVLRDSGLVPSASEAGRMLAQNGVRVDGSVVTDRGLTLPAGTYVVQVGKRKFRRVTVA